MYSAIVVALRNVRPHPNADKLQLATVCGETIIFANAKEGDLGVYFGPDGQLSHEMCLINKLYRKDPTTGEPMGGFFEDNRRVRALTLRGEKSNGYWTKIESLFWTGKTDFDEGDLIDTVNGKLICQKYYPPATLQRMSGPTNKKKNKKKFSYEMLKEHFETTHLQKNLHSLKEGQVIVISEKLHGTSARTGYIKINKPSWGTKILEKFDLSYSKWEYISGTRRTILNPEGTGYYGSNQFRQDWHNKIKTAGLRKGEILYYEIVGYLPNGKAIQGPITIKPKDKSLFPDYVHLQAMPFHYGCPNQTCEAYIYRIVQVTPDDKEIELNWPQVKQRCQELGLKPVPELETFVLTQNSIDSLVKRCETHCQTPSILTPLHIKEGVCLRVEERNILKYKSFEFNVLEGRAKESADYVDTEEVS